MTFYLTILLFSLFICLPFTGKAQVTHYQIIDPTDESATADTTDLYKKLGRFDKPAKAIVEGIKYYNRDSTFSIGNAGFWTTVPEYNFVDGFWIGQTLTASYKKSNDHEFDFEAQLYYTTARNKFSWQTTFSYLYNPVQLGKLKINAGYHTADYDTEEHLARLENTLYSLVFGRNFMKLFLKKYVEVENNFYPIPGLRLHQSLSIQRRWSVRNHTTFSFFNTTKNTSNIPDNPAFRVMPTNNALIGSAGFDYTLCYTCPKERRTNEIVYSYIPTISGRIVFGIPVGKVNRSSFQYAEAYLNQRFKFFSNATFDYKVGGGGFISKDNLYFPDFRHFGAYSLPSMKTFTDDGFFLIGYYRGDTDSKWIKGAANYLSRKLLLTRIDWFHRLKFSEGFHFRYLWTPTHKHYNEWGYSFGWEKYARLGVFIGFDRFRYHNLGVTISFPWLSSTY